MIKHNLADMSSDYDFNKFNLRNYIKKIKVEFIYKPNEDAVNEYMLDSFFNDLHNYYMNNEDKSHKEKSYSFQLEIDPYEKLENLQKNFISRIYMDKEILNDKDKDDKINFDEIFSFRKYKENFKFNKFEDSNSNNNINDNIISEGNY